MLDVFAGRKLTAQFPGAIAVFVVGDFNEWCTASTPMQCRSDGFWEAMLPEDAHVGRLAYWVWEAGHVGGSLCWDDRAAA